MVMSEARPSADVTESHLSNELVLSFDLNFKHGHIIVVQGYCTGDFWQMPCAEIFLLINNEFFTFLVNIHKNCLSQ